METLFFLGSRTLEFDKALTQSMASSKELNHLSLELTNIRSIMALKKPVFE